jgi:hypothetical protein
MPRHRRHVHPLQIRGKGSGHPFSRCTVPLEPRSVRQTEPIGAATALPAECSWHTRTPVHRDSRPPPPSFSLRWFALWKGTRTITRTATIGNHFFDNLQH